MEKTIKLNKQGFTLVELLAVIVILALLIIIVASTVLPTMNNTKRKALETYAARVMEQARANCMASVAIHGGSPSSTENQSACGSSSKSLTLKDVMGQSADDKTYSLNNFYVTLDSNGNYVVNGKVTDNSKNRSCIRNGVVASAEAGKADQGC